MKAKNHAQCKHCKSYQVPQDMKIPHVETTHAIRECKKDKKPVWPQHPGICENFEEKESPTEA